MSDELLDIERQIAELEKKRQQLLAEKREETLHQLKETIRLFGFTAKELGLGGPVVSPSPTRSSRRKPDTYLYKDPVTGETWAGNTSRPGRKPDWVKARMADKTIEECRVDSQAGNETADGATQSGEATQGSDQGSGASPDASTPETADSDSDSNAGAA